MDIETQFKEETLVMTPNVKRIGAANSQEFKDATLDKLDQNSRQVVLNLEHVEFIDSSGIGALVSIFKDLERDHRHFVVCQASSGITNLFKLTGLEKVLKIFPTIDQGIHNLTEGS